MAQFLIGLTGQQIECASVAALGAYVAFLQSMRFRPRSHLKRTSREAITWVSPRKTVHADDGLMQWSQRAGTDVSGRLHHRMPPLRERRLSSNLFKDDYRPPLRAF